MPSPPLVSVIVITYNSEKYIVDTLNSARRQSYPNLELIISDDGSTDSTVEICARWLEENKKGFVRSELVTVAKNTGVASNCNRGLISSKGEWIKIIAGDDLLSDNSINDYMDFISQKDGCFVFAFPSILVEPDNPALKLKKESFYRNCGYFFSLPPAEQFNYLLINNLCVNPATLFCKRINLADLGGFDQEFQCEDLPLYLKVVFNGFQLVLLEKETVIYRVHMNSQSFEGQVGLINKFWFKEYFKIRKKYISLRLFKNQPLVVIEFFVQNLARYIIIILGNKKYLLRILQGMRLISPMYFSAIIRKSKKITR